VQVKVVENHQNGKDTHIRGLKIYAKDERVEPTTMDVLGSVDEEEGVEEDLGIRKRTRKVEKGFIKEPDWMGEPELR
jgi:anaphase-promoting complex subunit 10